MPVWEWFWSSVSQKRKGAFLHTASKLWSPDVSWTILPSECLAFYTWMWSLCRNGKPLFYSLWLLEKSLSHWGFLCIPQVLFESHPHFCCWAFLSASNLFSLRCPNSSSSIWSSFWISASKCSSTSLVVWSNWSSRTFKNISTDAFASILYSSALLGSRRYLRNDGLVAPEEQSTLASASQQLLVAMNRLSLLPPDWQGSFYILQPVTLRNWEGRGILVFSFLLFQCFVWLWNHSNPGFIEWVRKYFLLLYIF